LIRTYTPNAGMSVMNKWLLPFVQSFSQHCHIIYRPVSPSINYYYSTIPLPPVSQFCLYLIPPIGPASSSFQWLKHNASFPQHSHNPCLGNSINQSINQSTNPSCRPHLFLIYNLSIFTPIIYIIIIRSHDAYQSMSQTKRV
jgi:hypothetical protein